MVCAPPRILRHPARRDRWYWQVEWGVKRKPPRALRTTIWRTARPQVRHPARGPGSWGRRRARSWGVRLLKRLAGGNRAGRPLAKPVYHYTLSWGQDERPGRAEMSRAVDESLRVLGMKDRQALGVAHNDTRHPHVHVVVNRVSAENGRAASRGNDRLKLSRWAERWEREHGRLRCKRRAEQGGARTGGGRRAQAPGGDGIADPERRPRPARHRGNGTPRGRPRRLPTAGSSANPLPRCLPPCGLGGKEKAATGRRRGGAIFLAPRPRAIVGTSALWEQEIRPGDGSPSQHHGS